MEKVIKYVLFRRYDLDKSFKKFSSRFFFLLLLCESICSTRKTKSGISRRRLALAQVGRNDCDANKTEVSRCAGQGRGASGTSEVRSHQ